MTMESTKLATGLQVRVSVCFECMYLCAEICRLKLRSSLNFKEEL